MYICKYAGIFFKNIFILFVFVFELYQADYKKWMKSIAGNLRVVAENDASFKNSSSVERLYERISEQFPEFLESDVDTSNEIEMVGRLSTLAEEMKAIMRPQKINPFETVREDTIESVANQIMMGIYSSAHLDPQSKLEFSNISHEAERKELERRSKEVQQMLAEDIRNLEKEISRQNRTVERLNKIIFSRSLNLSLAAEQKRAQKFTRKIYDQLMNPTRKKHIPDGIKEYVANALRQFDGMKIGSGKTVDAAVLDKILTQIKKNDSGTLEYTKEADGKDKVTLNDEVLERMNAQMDAVKLLEADAEKARVSKEVSDEEVKQLSVEYMKAVNEFLKMLNGYINQTNRAFVDGKNVEIAEFTEGLMDDLARKKPVKDFGGKNGFGTSIVQGVRNFANGLKYESVSATMFFEMMGEHGVMLDHTFRAGQDAQNRHLDEYVIVMAKATDGKYSTRVAGGYGNNRVNVTIDGKNVDVSKAQLMSLYCLWQRPAARNHLEAQGAAFLDSEGGEMKSRTFAITQETFDMLMSKLSADDIRVAQTIQKFLSRQCASWGNEASMKMYGYTMFHEDFYFPIRVSKGVRLARGKEWGSAAGEMNLEFSSFTNSVKPNSTSAIVIDNIFDVSESHVQRMAAYNAYAPICHDLQRVLKNGEVREAITNNMGREAMTYLFKFIEKVNGNAAGERGNTNTYGWLTKLGNLNKRAAVAANFSSAFKQFDSIFRACDEIDAKYLTAARTWFGRKDGNGNYGQTYRRMVENSGIAKMKMLGYSDAGFGKSLREQWDDDYVKTPGDFRKIMDSWVPIHTVLKGYDNMTDSVLFGMGLASKADETVWVALYRACELETADKHKNLSSEERTRKATERFNEIIGRTQVVDSVMDSTPFSQNVLGTGFGAFMNEPVKTFGHLMVAAEAMRDKKPGAGKKLGKVITSMLFAGLVVEPLKTALASLLRDNEDDSEQLFRKIFKLYSGVDFTDSAQEPISVSGVMSSEFVDGLIGIVPLFGQIYDIVSDVVGGYSSSRLETEGIEKFVQYATALIGYDAKEKIQTKTKAKLTIDLIGATGKIVGLPFATILRDIQILPKAYMSLTDNYIMQWEFNKWFYNLGSGTTRTNYGFYDIMANSVKADDADAYQYIRNDLESTVTGKNSIGVTYKKLRDEIKDRNGKYIINSDLFLMEIQSEFNLPFVVSDMTAEKAIRQVYAKAVNENMSNEDALKALPSTPGIYSYEKKDEDGNVILEGKGEDAKPVEVKMTITEYTKFIEDVGLLSRNTVAKLAASDEFKRLPAESQIYCLDKAYEFAGKYYRAEVNPNFNWTGSNKWMKNMAGKKLNCTEIAQKILESERERD